MQKGLQVIGAHVSEVSVAGRDQCVCYLPTGIQFSVSVCVQLCCVCEQSGRQLQAGLAPEQEICTERDPCWRR